MSLYTRTGDDGSTGLFGGQRVEKSDLRIATIGDVDETNAAIGCIQDKSLESLQSLLFDLGADLATPESSSNSAVRRIDKSDILFVESWIDAVDAQNEKLTSFVLPGGSNKGAKIHLARTICRRAERKAVALNKQEGCSLNVIILLNRLSDLLFALARLTNMQEGVKDTPWVPNYKEES